MPVSSSVPAAAKEKKDGPGRGAGVLAGTVIFALLAYQANALFFRRPVPTVENARIADTLSSIVPVKMASVDPTNHVLIVKLRDPGFEKMAQGDQIAVGTRLIEAMHRPEIHKAYVIYNTEVFVLSLSESGPILSRQYARAGD